MKKKLPVALGLCLAFVFILTGCGVQVTGLTVTLPERISVGESVSAALSAAYDQLEAADEDKEKAFARLDIAWASSDEAVATVDETGAVTGVAGGTATITATAGEGEHALTAEQTITVTVPLQGLQAPPTLTLAINKTDSAKLEVRPVPADATNAQGAAYGETLTQCEYTSSDETVATVNADGTVTAVANGEAVITVTLEGKSAETKVTVTTAAKGIALEKSEGILYVGGSYAIKAYTQPEEAPESTYTYKSADTGIATVSERGVVTGIRAGTAAITVTSAEGFEAVYTVTVRVKPAVSPSDGAGAGTPAPPPASAGGDTGGTAPEEKPHVVSGKCWCGTWHECPGYHGDDTDSGYCPICGGHYSPGVPLDPDAGVDLGGWD